MEQVFGTHNHLLTFADRDHGRSSADDRDPPLQPTDEQRGSTRSTGRDEIGMRSVIWSPSAERVGRQSGGRFWRRHSFIVSVKTDQDAERSPPSELSTAPVLLSPFRARAAHVVQFGPVRVEQSGPEPAPPLGSHVEAAARRREQNSRHVRI
jgi:hypothetical protein